MDDNRPMDGLRALLAGDDTERRAIERALHDGPQQRLITLLVVLQLALRVLETDPQEAGRHIEDARATAREALAEVRALAELLHPPLLDAQGLVAALRMVAAAAPLPTRVEGSLEDEPSPAAAVTVYRCCVAALDSAEGDAASATISVGARDGALTFDVLFRNARVDPAALSGLAARAQALGGALELDAARVGGRLPLAS
jgi:signal transduction histidine kinase